MNRYQRDGRARRSSDGRRARPTSGIRVVTALTVLAAGTAACSSRSAAPAAPARVYSGRYDGVGGPEAPKVAFTVEGNRIVGFTTDIMAACTFADGGTAERVLTFPDPNTITTHVSSLSTRFYDFSDTYTVPGTADAVMKVAVVGHLLGNGMAYGNIGVSTIQGLQPGCRTPTGPAQWTLVNFGKSAAGSGSNSTAASS